MSQKSHYYRVTVAGNDWYFGPTAHSAMQHVSDALSTGRASELEVKIESAPSPGIKVQCCAGVDFHASDCFFARDAGAVNQI